MPRTKKTGLDYYYKGVHDWDQFAIMDLVNKYGPVGYCVYDVILGKVYENGYYLDIPLEKLALYVMRTVGNRWISDTGAALAMIAYCAELGLFDGELFKSSVITSVDIQKHYADVSARRKADKSKYWLLKEEKDEEDDKEEEKNEKKRDADACRADCRKNPAPRLSDTVAPVSETITPVSAAITPVSAAITPVSAAINPASETITPVSAAITPVSAAINPVSAAINPVSAAINPVSAAINPIYDAITPVSDAINPVSDAINPVSETYTPIYAAIMQQRKEKQRKENKNKANESKANESKANESKANESKANESRAWQREAVPAPAANAANTAYAAYAAYAAADAPDNAAEYAFATVTGRNCTKSDRDALAWMREAGADDRLIASVIGDVGKRSRTSIGSMKYFVPIVLERLNRQKNASSPRFDGAGAVAESSVYDEIERLLDEEWELEMKRMDECPYEPDYGGF